MHFIYTSSHSTAFSVEIIPLIPGEQLASQLAQLAQMYALPALPPIKGEDKEIVSFYHAKGVVFLIGLGAKHTFPSALAAFRRVFQRNSLQWGEKILLNLSYAIASGAHADMLAESAANGFEIGLYRIGRFKAEPDKLAPVEEVCVYAQKDVAASLEKGKMAGETQRRIMALVDAPANKMLPSDLVNWVQESGKNYGYSVTAWNRDEVVANGLHALYAVGKGSVNGPNFVVAEYTPDNASATMPTIAFVGKGVTYDTGGLNIKVNNMHFMKSDMAGAAAVLGAIELVAKWKLPIRLIVATPIAENDVDANSMKPGDIIGSYSGKTIEVIDTDAEGRLILADALSYTIRKFHPEIIIDLATLTGNSVMALGYQAGAMFSNSDALANALYLAGQSAGERLWRMPLWAEYGEDMVSEIADMRNLSPRPVAGAVTAAKFLEAFIDEHPQWAHLDIAGMAFGDHEFAKGKAATAYGVRLLANFLLNIIEKGMP